MKARKPNLQYVLCPIVELLELGEQADRNIHAVFQRDRRRAGELTHRCQSYNKIEARDAYTGTLQ